MASFIESIHLLLGLPVAFKFFGALLSFSLICLFIVSILFKLRLLEIFEKAAICPIIKKLSLDRGILANYRPLSKLSFVRNANRWDRGASGSLEDASVFFTLSIMVSNVFRCLGE